MEVNLVSAEFALRESLRKENSPLENLGKVHHRGGPRPPLQSPNHQQKIAQITISPPKKRQNHHHQVNEK